MERQHLTKTGLFWQDPDMTIKEALQTAHERLKTLSAPVDVSRSEAEILLAHTLKRERTWLIAHSEELLTPSKEKAFFAFIARRAQHEPIAHLTSVKEFHGLTFQVNKHVLIPRPETEEMIDLVQRSTINNQPSTLIWDVGTGSGVIAVSVNHLFPNIPVIASDVSKRALSLAEKNANRILSPHHDIQFIQGSLLTNRIKHIIQEQRPKRLIVLANLPYLPLSDRSILQKDVIDFEPHGALFTDKDGNALILKLLEQLRRFLKAHPIPVHAFFEFDPPQATTLNHEAKQQFPKANIQIHEDTCGRKRFLEIDTT